MKKYIMMVCISTAALYAAEPAVMQNENQLLIPYKGTLIKIIRGTMGRSIIPNADLTIVGLHEQRKLQQSPSNERDEIGILRVVKEIFVKYKHCDSVSDDDTYKPYTPAIAKSWNNSYPITLNPMVFAVAEPCIEFGLFKEDAQKQYRYCNDAEYFGDAAINKAEEDLACCYQNALSAGLWFFGARQNKNIAFASLGTNGFPREEAASVAVKAVTDFIERNLHKYALIQLFVKKHSEFALYKRLLVQWLDEE